MDIPAEIEKLSPKAGDLVIIRCPEEKLEHMQWALADMPRDMIEPNVMFWVLPHGTTAEIMEPEEKEKLRRFLDEGVHPIS